MSVIDELLSTAPQVFRRLGIDRPMPLAALRERMTVNAKELETAHELITTTELRLATPAEKRATIFHPVVCTRDRSRITAEQFRDKLEQFGKNKGLYEQGRYFTQIANASMIEKLLAASRRWVPSQSGAMLDGVTISVKDLMYVGGFRRTGGTGMENLPAATEDCASIARLRVAGAAVMGMANLHELAFGITSANPHFGSVVNPLDSSLIPGGSSGGSAAGVAAGAVDVSIGTDTGGSVRIPAACCGVMGFKPTYGSVPLDGLMKLSPTLDHIGPIGRDVDLISEVFSALSGDKPKAPQIIHKFSDIRIGIPDSYFWDHTEPVVTQHVKNALAVLEKLGATVVSIKLPYIEYSGALQFIISSYEAAKGHSKILLERPDCLGEDVRVRLEMATLIPAAWYSKAMGLLQIFRMSIGSVAESVDFILTPTLRVPPPRVGQSTIQIGTTTFPLHPGLSGLTAPFSLLGYPTISMVCGWTEDRRPVSMQISAAPGRDWSVLALAKTLNKEYLGPG